MSRTAQRIDASLAEIVRGEAARGPNHHGCFWSNWSANSEGEYAEATGRARCCCCGEKIARGSKSLKIFLDNGGGTWTASWRYLHADSSDCLTNEAS